MTIDEVRQHIEAEIPTANAERRRFLEAVLHEVLPHYQAEGPCGWLWMGPQSPRNMDSVIAAVRLYPGRAGGINPRRAVAEAITPGSMELRLFSRCPGLKNICGDPEHLSTAKPHKTRPVQKRAQASCKNCERVIQILRTVSGAMDAAFTAYMQTQGSTSPDGAAGEA
jgi:hypothetical protein